jgi:hypothetical protein
VGINEASKKIYNPKRLATPKVKTKNNNIKFSKKEK